MTELMSIGQVAEYFNVSIGRAYALMSLNNIERVSGYPADQVTAISRLKPGTRTDLARRANQPEER